jgi:uncharacterized protein
VAATSEIPTMAGAIALSAMLRPRAADGRAAAVRAFVPLLFAFCVMLLTAGIATAQPKFPPLTGRIVDDAGILTAADRAEILEMLTTLEGKATDQLVVFTTRSLQGYPIEDYGYQLGRAWGIGQKDKNNGIILIVAPNDKKVRIEVGRGLEPIMTDLMSGLIVQNVILPAFRRGDFSGGVKAAVRDIRDVLLGDAEEVKKRAQGGSKRSDGGDDLSNLIPLLFFLMIIFVMYLQYRQAAQQARNLPPGARRQRGSGGAPVIIPGGWGGSSGGWSSGGDSGGGFSGGGGDFGGGGASGSW